MVIGVAAAMPPISTLLAGTIETILGSEWPGLKYVGSFTTLAGLTVFLWAATYLLLQNRHVVDALHSELKDRPDVAREAGSMGTARLARSSSSGTLFI